MSKYVMWIILGGLILIVIAFLVFSSLWDRKKRKKLEQEKTKIRQNAISKISEISIWIVAIMNEVKKQVDSFVPSIGKFKMSEINNIAKKELKYIKSIDDFKTIAHDKEIYKSFIQHINALEKTRANLWAKKLKKEVTFWKSQISQKPDVLEKQKKFAILIEKRIKKLYE